jgi:hypothetical protein
MLGHMKKQVNHSGVLILLKRKTNYFFNNFIKVIKVTLGIEPVTLRTLTNMVEIKRL